MADTTMQQQEEGRGQNEQQRKDSVMNGSWIPSHLQLTVIQGRNLALKSKNVNSEVYVIVQLDKEKVSTALLIRDTHPTWNQTFEIPLMSFQSILEIQVRQKSKFTDDHIGQLRLPVTNFTISRRLHKSWYKLAARPGKISSKIRGDLQIATSFLSKWDSKETTGSQDNSASTTPDFNVPGLSGRKMLMRSKSEYKSKSKNSPKNEKEKRRMFDRIRKSKSNAFEECEDFLVSVRTPDSPPTPPFGSERKKVESPLVSSDFNGGSLQSSSGNSFQMFSEATQLEKSGVLDLSRVDPNMRLELGKQRFVNSRTLSRESDVGSRNDEEQDRSPTRSYSFRHKRPLRAQSLNQQQTFSSSFDGDHTHMTTPTTGTSTPNAVTSPNLSTVTTYRATASIKRRKKLKESMSQDQSSIESVRDLMPSEHCNNSVSESVNDKSLPSKENGRTQDVKQKPSDESLVDNNEANSPSIGQQTVSLQISDVDGNPVVTNQDEHTNSVDGPLQNNADKREKSVPTESQTLQREDVQLRKSRRRFASETVDRKRHSADIESLLRLTTPQSPGKHDGLGNVLNTNQIKMKLKPKLTPDRGQDNMVSLSQPVDHVITTSPPITATPPPNTTSLYLVNSQQDLPGLISPTDSDRGEGDPPITPLDQLPQSGSGLGGLMKAESLPAIKRMYQWDNRPDLVYPKAHQPSPATDLDKATFFESEGSLSTVSNLYPPSNMSSSLDSSFSSDYTSLSNNRRLDDDNPSDSQCTTPTDVTPTITREGTPSPQEQSPLIENTINKENHKPTRKPQHTFKPLSKENGIPLLPPSLTYATLPTRGKFANSIKSSDTTDLVSAAAKVLIPYEDSKGHQHHHIAVDHHLPPNIRPSRPVYSLSASNSGRTSPVLEEPNEEDLSYDIRNNPTTTVTTPLSNSVMDKTSNTSNKSNEGVPAGSLPTVPPDTPEKTKVRRKLPSATSYESSSLQRRKPNSSRGGGLMKTISLYQDNKRLNSGGGGAKRALFRGHSLDVESEKLATTKVSTTHVQRSSPRKLPTTTGVQKRRSRDEPSNTKTTSLSTKQNNGDSPKTITKEARNESSTISGSTGDTLVPTSNGSVPSNHNTAASSNSNQFSLPPPPDVSHTTVAEHLCGMNQSKQTSNDAEQEELSQSDNIVGAGSNTKGDWRSSQSTIATSSDEYEELLEDELERLSKQELIHLVVEVNEKFKKSKRKVADIQQYLDKLLVKVMDHHPELLCSL